MKIKCPNCNKENCSRFFLDRNDYSDDENVKIKYFCCNECGNVFPVKNKN